MKKILIFSLGILILGSSCGVIRQDQVGVRRTLGRVKPKVLTPGAVLFNPFTTALVKAPIRTVNLAITASLPSREGLTVNSEISILYKIKSAEFVNILQGVGSDYEDALILPVFRSAAADICSRFDAKDMHSSKRALIEKDILQQMMNILEKRGFIIEQVLMKSIQLPSSLSKAIEEKLAAEQDAQRMEFIKERERKDAERRAIQAEGEKQAQIISSEAQKRKLELEAEGRANAMKTEAEAIMKANEQINKNLTPAVLKFKQIEAFKHLSGSNNTKVIITDGKTPFLSIPDDIR